MFVDHSREGRDGGMFIVDPADVKPKTQLVVAI
jgi:hypothetical protein